ncbi:MAG: hypothetical protein NTW64_02845 [Candidatus Omnitrophica bacterium]|nr:hypothetical protein [Candidatus Omnitrophota bacterium]
MKKFSIMLFILSFLIAAGFLAESMAIAKEETKAAPPVVDPVVARREKEAKAKETLGLKEWTIYLITMTEKKMKTDTDLLTFAEGKITSKNLSPKGFPSSNYTVTVQEDETIIWETMQTADNGDIAFWRGELQGELMRGVLSMHPVKGEVKDYTFSTVPIEVKPVEPEKKVETKKKGR